MRYLIIDTEKGMFNDKFQYGILSEEESLAKFKEIWDDGYMEGAHPMADPAEWEEFKKTL